MYDLTDYAENKRQLRTRLFALGAPAAALLAATIVSFCLRWPQAVTMALCILLFSLCVFGHGMLLRPILAYGKHLRHALDGRTRTTCGAYMGMEQSAVSREGVMVFPMTLNVGEKDKDEDDRLFYFDANLPRPVWAQGERLRVTSYDKMVTAWEREA